MTASSSKHAVLFFLASSCCCEVAKAEGASANEFKADDKAKIEMELKAAQDLVTSCHDASCLGAVKAKLKLINDIMICVGDGGHGGGRPCGGGNSGNTGNGGGGNVGNSGGGTGNGGGNRGEDKR